MSYKKSRHKNSKYREYTDEEKKEYDRIKALKNEARLADKAIKTMQYEDKLNERINKAKQYKRKTRPTKFQKFADKTRSMTNKIAEKIKSAPKKDAHQAKKGAPMFGGFGQLGTSSKSADPFGAMFGASNSKKKKKKNDPFSGMFG
jgi:hypothetical protein